MKMEPRPAVLLKPLPKIATHLPFDILTIFGWPTTWPRSASAELGNSHSTVLAAVLSLMDSGSVTSSANTPRPPRPRPLTSTVRQALLIFASLTAGVPSTV
ncbi:hypothetical protein D3C86_1633370 [compost metagenome]